MNYLTALIGSNDYVSEIYRSWLNHIAHKLHVSVVSLLNPHRGEFFFGEFFEERDGLNEKITSLKSHSLSLDHDVRTYKELIQKEQALVDRNRQWIEQNRGEVVA